MRPSSEPCSKLYLELKQLVATELARLDVPWRHDYSCDHPWALTQESDLSSSPPPHRSSPLPHQPLVRAPR